MAAIVLPTPPFRDRNDFTQADNGVTGASEMAP
jgi:hypothetical protein